MAILERIPTEKELLTIIGVDGLEAFNRMRGIILELYDMDSLWSDGGKKWKYELKYRRGGKTLCCLYADEGRFGLMIIFGKQERDKVEAFRGALSERTLEQYDSAMTYHDGKWVMFDRLLPSEELKILLKVKRAPNKKPVPGHCEVK